MALLTKATPKENLGEILGLNDSIGAFVRILGPIGATSLYSINIIYPWLCNALIIMLVLFIAVLLYIRVNRSQMPITIEKEQSYTL